MLNNQSTKSVLQNKEKHLGLGVLSGSQTAVKRDFKPLKNH